MIDPKAIQTDRGRAAWYAELAVQALTAHDMNETDALHFALEDLKKALRWARKAQRTERTQQ